MSISAGKILLQKKFPYDIINKIILVVKTMKLSLVVPCYNEADNVSLFQEAVIQAFDGCGYDYEIVFVDDGSKDATLHILKKIFLRYLRKHLLFRAFCAIILPCADNFFAGRHFQNVPFSAYRG